MEADGEVRHFPACKCLTLQPECVYKVGCCRQLLISFKKEKKEAVIECNTMTPSSHSIFRDVEDLNTLTSQLHPELEDSLYLVCC